MLLEAKGDITAFADFPEAHWRKIWSANPFGSQQRSQRRTDVVGIFPDDDAFLLHLSACVLIEIYDEWQVSDRPFLSEASLAALTPSTPAVLVPRHDTPQELIDNLNLATA